MLIHVVTDRPMEESQRIIFDEVHHSGVYKRVNDKIQIVNVFTYILKNVMRILLNIIRKRQ